MGRNGYRRAETATVRFSAFNLLRQALTGNTGWPEQWRSPEPKAAYDAVIVGGGGHGLATAYYLAKEHGMRNIAVLEKGWLGGGNTGPQHHDHPLQLSLGRERGALRARAQAVGRACRRS